MRPKLILITMIVIVALSGCIKSPTYNVAVTTEGDPNTWNTEYKNTGNNSLEINIKQNPSTLIKYSFVDDKRNKTTMPLFQLVCTDVDEFNDYGNTTKTYYVMWVYNNPVTIENRVDANTLIVYPNFKPYYEYFFEPKVNILSDFNESLKHGDHITCRIHDETNIRYDKYVDGVKISEGMPRCFDKLDRIIIDKCNAHRCEITVTANYNDVIFEDYDAYSWETQHFFAEYLDEKCFSRECVDC